MWRTGKRRESRLRGVSEQSAGKAGAAAFAGVLGFTVLMITREGMETVLLMNTLLFQIKAPAIMAGAVAGTLAAALRRLALVPLRVPRQSVAVLPGHRDFPCSCLSSSS